mmetsp:Transcript_9410/g.28374  ORF Transcript_9410/g.28374 Transcript_9410/m.28374 type:complete len:524 (-) Transcript_9410:1064-2635(-)|eukprot:CAMPEP_0198736720 /NCGR_PEP_ID=MMETSP1475-20131203/67499_1 /TAXON_ID= ORGANISM="Unidentified sp., Strain CCMP1999" /NCGR_SAMPLE_ID=MMETSP1475 /ASSEMBLY_ACC=CAM_ASM_001111 /LENGTH=523 /DNA_ID=CAMNT_0044500569 /DNA_START=84 /DNA_END=1655 /DNA_ORIENTATION=+
MSSRMEREEMRKKNYKKAIDPEESRRKREENAVEIRKSKREENLMKRRKDLATQLNIGSFNEKEDFVERNRAIIQGVFSDDPAVQLESTIGVRRMLSVDRNPPIDEVVKAGVVPVFTSFLKRTDNPKLQFEASWALTNIASGTSEHTNIVVSNGAVPLFAELLSSPNDDVREQAVWALGNIAGDGPNCRDIVLNSGALRPLLTQLTSSSPQSMLRNATWALSNLCRGKPKPAFESVAPSLPILTTLVCQEDEEVVTDALWAFSYLSDGEDMHIQAVVNTNVIGRLVELLMHRNLSIQVPALRTIGNIVTGNEEQTQKVIDHNALSALKEMLNSPRKSIRKEACWTISNITAGTVRQIQAVLDAGFVPVLLEHLRTADFDVKKEAAWAISNATYGGSPEQVVFLVRSGCIQPMCDLLSAPDPKIIKVAMDGLEQILKLFEKNKEAENPAATAIEEFGGLDKLEELQHHENTDIYEKAVSLLVEYFGGDEVRDMTPQAVGQQYAFGLNSTDNPAGGFNFDNSMQQ